MDFRAKPLLSLRPELRLEPTIDQSVEHFQNKTLRPILKFQNDLLIQVFKQHIRKRKNVFHKQTKPQQEEYIKQALQKDLKLKNLLLGCVLGLFTLAEWQQFELHEKELIRRTTAMLIQRLQSQLEKL